MLARWTFPAPPPAFILVLMLLLAPIAVRAGRSPIPLGPDLEASEATRLEGERWYLENDILSMAVERLDGDARRAYLRTVAGLEDDPFDGDGGRGYLTFRITLVNHSDAPVMFQSQWCRILTSRSEFQHPLDYPRLKSAYRFARLRLPEVMERLRPVLLDGTQMVEPGGHLEGLLVFRAPHPRTRRMRVEVPVTSGDGGRHRLVMVYRKRAARTGSGEGHAPDDGNGGRLP